MGSDKKKGRGGGGKIEILSTSTSTKIPNHKTSKQKTTQANKIDNFLSHFIRVVGNQIIITQLNSSFLGFCHYENERDSSL